MVTIPAGMKPWAAGDAAPADWNEYEPLLLEQIVPSRDRKVGDRWHAIGTRGIFVWDNTRRVSNHVIAYTPTEPESGAADERVRVLREALAGIIAHFEPNGSDGNAPGHGHDRLGIWDDDAGNDAAGLSNLPCEWCATWKAARGALERTAS